MSRLPDIQAAFRQALTENADIFFPYEGIFTKVQNGQVHEYQCQFDVIDPVKADRATTMTAEAFARSENASYTEVRLLKVKPGDRRPPEGAVLTTPWDGGRLELRHWSQEAKFSTQAIGLCLLRR